MRRKQKVVKDDWSLFGSLEEAKASCRKAPKTLRKYAVVWEALVQNPSLTNRELDSLLEEAGLRRDTKVIRNTRSSLRALRLAGERRGSRMHRFYAARQELALSGSDGDNSDKEAGELAGEVSLGTAAKNSALRGKLESLLSLVREDSSLEWIRISISREKSTPGLEVSAEVGRLYVSDIT